MGKGKGSKNKLILKKTLEDPNEHGVLSMTTSTTYLFLFPIIPLLPLICSCLAITFWINGNLLKTEFNVFLDVYWCVQHFCIVFNHHLHCVYSYYPKYVAPVTKTVSNLDANKSSVIFNTVTNEAY